MPGEEEVTILNTLAHINKLSGHAVSYDDFDVHVHKHVHLNGEVFVVGWLLVIYTADYFVVAKLTVAKKSGWLYVDELLVSV